MKVRNMVSRQSGREVANQFIIEGDGVIAFQSYKSTIATVDLNKYTIEIGIDWDYSTTTSKYRNMFFERFVGFDGLTNKKGIQEAIDEGVYFDGFSTWKVTLVC